MAGQIERQFAQGLKTLPFPFQQQGITSEQFVRLKRVSRHGIPRHDLFRAIIGRAQINEYYLLRGLFHILSAEFAERVPSVSQPEQYKPVTPPPELLPSLYDGSDGGMISFLETHHDPDFWHVIVDRANYDLDTTYTALAWILEQRDCDRGTALLMFQRLTGDAYLDRPLSEFEGTWAERDARIVARLSDRIIADRFEHRELLCPPAGYIPSKFQTKQDEKSEKPDTIPFSIALFEGQPDGRKPVTDFDIDEERIFYR